MEEQEVQVTVVLTLSLSVNKSKEQIKKGIGGTLYHLANDLNSPLRHELAKYKEGDILTNLVDVDIVDVKEEAEIYENN